MRDVPRHLPVLQTTVLEVLSPAEGEAVLDVTLGLGGHAREFLRAIGPTGNLIGLDADEENLRLANEALKEWGERVTTYHANFRELPELSLPQVDILFADLGVSSPHLDDPGRGFTFRTDAPLDMRYDRSRGETAAELLARMSADDLTNVFRKFGELQQARRLGQLLAGASLRSTGELKARVEEAYTFRANALLPQVFQALRIAVNDELHALDTLKYARNRV